MQAYIEMQEMDDLEGYCLVVYAQLNAPNYAQGVEDAVLLRLTPDELNEIAEDNQTGFSPQPGENEFAPLIEGVTAMLTDILVHPTEGIKSAILYEEMHAAVTEAIEPRPDVTYWRPRRFTV